MPRVPQTTSRVTRGTALVGGILVDGPNASPAGVVAYVPQVLKVPIVALSTGTKDTTIDLPTKGLVLDVWVDITTLEATATTKTIDVGLLNTETGGDLDGFLDGVSTAAAGIVRGVPTLTAGGNETYFASTTRGVLLSSITAGADVAGDVGTYYEFPHILNGTAVSLVYVLGSAHTELAGNIYVSYVDLT